MDISFDDVTVAIDGVTIAANVRLQIKSGQIGGIVGPNGSGKSTLLRTLYRFLRPTFGAVVVGPDDVWTLPARESAKRVAAVPQERSTDFEFSVREIVEMGLIPHTALFASRSADATVRVDAAMARVDILGLAERTFATLSGGERQRVLVARALVQSTPVLVLDEPTNHLDIRHQLELLELLRDLRLTTLIAIHDLNLAAAYCDSIHVLDGGRLVASGATRDVLTATLVSQVFGIECTASHDVDGVVRFVYRPGTTARGSASASAQPSSDQTPP